MMTEECQSAHQSMRLGQLNTVRSSALLHRVPVRCYQQKTSCQKPIWHAITLAKGHWAKLRVGHQIQIRQGDKSTLTFYYDKWRTCSRAETKHTLNRHSGLTCSWEKWQGHRPLGAGYPNCQKGCWIVENWGTESVVAIHRLLRELFTKTKGIHPIPLQVRGLNAPEELNQGDSGEATSNSVSCWCNYTELHFWNLLRIKMNSSR